MNADFLFDGAFRTHMRGHGSQNQVNNASRKFDLKYSHCSAERDHLLYISISLDASHKKPTLCHGGMFSFPQVNVKKTESC